MSTIPLSKKTEQLRSEVRGIIQEREKLNPLAAGALADDKTDLEKIGGTLATIQAKKEILTARLTRKRQALFESLFADAKANVEAARAEVKRATDAWRLQRDQWKQAVFEAHPRAAAERIANDETLLPTSIRDARLELQEAQKYSAAAERAVISLDESAWKIRRTTAAMPVDGWQAPDFIGNAAKLVPEMADAGRVAPVSVPVFALNRNHK